MVAPFVGAWIEIMFVCDNMEHDMVAPFVGAWIEICINSLSVAFVWSLRSSERGLKYMLKEQLENQTYVAPFVGAWIEIHLIMMIETAV